MASGASESTWPIGSQKEPSTSIDELRPQWPNEKSITGWPSRGDSGRNASASPVEGSANVREAAPAADTDHAWRPPPFAYSMETEPPRPRPLAHGRLSHPNAT